MLLMVKLKFRRMLLIGNEDLSQGEEFRGILHSDTIFSAIANQWVKIQENNLGSCSVEELISELDTDTPPLRISSAFPFVTNEYYLPTPYGTDELYMETLKDVPFLELYDFIELAEGNYDGIRKKQLKNPINDVMINFITPRVTIDRMTTSTNIYQTGGWLMNEGGGLYFLIDLKDESLKDKLGLCIRMLGEEGIGGDRSIGYGLFDPEVIPIDGAPGWSDLFKQKGGDNICYYLLSLCCPSNKNEAKEALSYQIISRKGWISSSSSVKQMKRRECKMFAEGSLFKTPVKGQLSDVTPSEFRSEHNVYRYGLGMMMEMFT